MERKEKHYAFGGGWMCENARGDHGIYSDPENPDPYSPKDAATILAIQQLDKQITEMDARWKRYSDELLHKYGAFEAAEMIEREEKVYQDMVREITIKKSKLYDQIDGTIYVPLDSITFSPLTPTNEKEIKMTPTEARLLSERLGGNIDSLLKDAFYKAANHARETLQRNTTANRVGYFVNGLRREMQTMLNEMRTASRTTEWIGLCNFLQKFQDTRQWVDIAIPNENPSLWTFSITLNGVVWSMNLARLKEMLMDAQNVYTDPILKTTDTVRTELDELERGMVSMFETVNRVKRINEEADKVVGSLSDLVETLPRSA